MFDQKHIELVKALHDRTAERVLAWSSVGERQSAVEVLVGDYFVQIDVRHSDYNNPDPDYVVSLVNADREVLDEFTDVDIAREVQERGSDDFNPYATLAETYRRASRIARGADAALAAVLEALRQIKPISEGLNAQDSSE